MKRNFLFYIGILLVCSIFSAQAQSSLSNQYQVLKEKSNNYQEYKVIKSSTLDGFWKGVQDSMSVTKKKLVEAHTEIESQKASILQLQQQVRARDERMQKDNLASQQVSVTGINVDKQGYVSTSYVLYGILLALLGFVFVRYQSSNRITVSTQKDYDAAKLQIEEYKRKLLETQTSLGRELQTERNKVDELQSELGQLRSKPSAR